MQGRRTNALLSRVVRRRNRAASEIFDRIPFRQRLDRRSEFRPATSCSELLEQSRSRRLKNPAVPPPLFHLPDRESAGQKRSIQVYFNRSSPFLKIHLFTFAFWPIDTGVVDKDIRRTEAGSDFIKKPLNFLFNRDVAGRS